MTNNTPRAATSHVANAYKIDLITEAESESSVIRHMDLYTEAKSVLLHDDGRDIDPEMMDALNDHP